MVALPVLIASMCYDLAQVVGWKYGLSENPWDAKGFYVLISATVIIAAVADYTPINPVRALYWSMILAGILTVPIFWFILIISNDRRIMRTTNTSWENFWIGAAAGGIRRCDVGADLDIARTLKVFRSLRSTNHIVH